MLCKTIETLRFSGGTCSIGWPSNRMVHIGGASTPATLIMERFPTAFNGEHYSPRSRCALKQQFVLDHLLHADFPFLVPTGLELVAGESLLPSLKQPFVVLVGERWIHPLHYGLLYLR